MVDFESMTMVAPRFESAMPTKTSPGLAPVKAKLMTTPTLAFLAVGARPAEGFELALRLLIRVFSD